MKHQLAVCSIYCIAMWVCAAGALAQETPVEEKTETAKPVSLEVWNARVQLLAGEYPQGQTQAMNELRLQQFTEAFIEKFDRSKIKFYAKVRDVRWADGVAQIVTESEFAQPRRVGRVQVYTGNEAVQLQRSTPLEVLMDLKTAASILPETQVMFEGTLEFHPAEDRGFRRGEAQEMYSVSHSDLGRRNVGRFTTSDYTCTVDGKMYPGRWSTASDDAESETQPTGQ